MAIIITTERARKNLKGEVGLIKELDEKGMKTVMDSL
jgi:hypothetical protein